MNFLFSNTDLRKLIVPLIFEQTLAITVGMVDTMMISSVGEAGVAIPSLLSGVVMAVALYIGIPGGIENEFFSWEECWWSASFHHVPAEEINSGCPRVRPGQGMRIIFNFPSKYDKIIDSIQTGCEWAYI